MGEKLIKPYEISVWEDKLTQIEGSDPAEYRLTETKLAIIGSDTMTGPNKIYEPVFTKNTNGEKTLTFSLKYKYFDPYIGNEDVVNPFAALLINERKVKLHYDNEWYEFIVKDHTESSEEYTWTYTCTDAFVLELSKNGYNLTFDSELNNNQGTASELAEKVLENSDWRLKSSDTFKQLIAEPIYKAILVSPNNVEIINVNSNSAASFNNNANIYIFYTYVKNQSGQFVQFIIRDDNRNYTIDSNNVITDTNYRIIDDLTYDATNQQFIDKNSNIIIQLETQVEGQTVNPIETRFQANRLAYGQLTTYDPVMGRTVNRYGILDENENVTTEIYGYTDYEYTTSNVIMNYITNGENFNILEDGTLQGWNPYTDQSVGEVNKLELVTYPELAYNKALVDLSTLSQIEGFLKVQFNGPLVINNNLIYNTLYNSGIENHASNIHSISKGDKFVFRWRAGKGELGQLSPVNTLGLIVAKYEQDAPRQYGYYYKHIKEQDIILHFVGQPHTAELPSINNIITGGTIETVIEGETTIENYVIDSVVQVPSSRYIYVNLNDNQSYVWDGLNSRFVLQDNSNYLPYYYLTAEAQESISNTILSDSTVRIGIFIYTTEAEQPIFIQDIQLTRFVKDETYTDREIPILIGNIPTATAQALEYYYVKPKEKAAAEDIETYTQLKELEERLGLNENTIVPLYNKDSEKTLTISASKSNCFNILQTIAETFECWIDLVVEHDPDTGYITYDEETGKPNKFVYLRNYVGKDNYAGFKYGINLDSIERNVNSDEIVSKLIVDQSQSEYTDEGFVSIGLAPSNISGESYILNFDYYYNQGLLNRTETEEDKYSFVQAVAELNKTLKTYNTERINLESSLVKLESNRTVYTELITSAQDNLTAALEEFQTLTGMSYADYLLVHNEMVEDSYIYTRNLNITEQSDWSGEGDYEYSWEDIFGVWRIYSFNGIDVNLVPPEFDSDTAIKITEFSHSRYPNATATYYTESGQAKLSSAGQNITGTITYVFQLENGEDLIKTLLEEENILDTVGEIYLNSSVINNYSGLLTNIEKEYWKIREQLRGLEEYSVKFWRIQDVNDQWHVRVDFSDYLVGASFRLSSSESIYQVTISKRYFDLETTDTTITITVPSKYQINSSASAQYTISTSPQTIKILPIQEEDGVEDKIKEIQAQKDELTNAFNNKYSRFIQEGTWNSTDYIDSEHYYLDALQISNTSAQPIVSYTINVVEISEIEDYEWYKFDAGDKTYVEDTEFFGWANKGGVLTPAREEVIVSEVEWHLDEPENNVITVQNYKTRFEDLFQRISAAVQTVQYNEATYAKISTLLDADGTLNNDVLVKSLNNISGQKYTLTTDGSISINGNQIEIRNLTNSSNRVIINNEGIQTSADGGNTWKRVIDGYGVNADAVISGSINTQNIIIGSDDNPSFRWDKSGISAYRSDGTTIDDEGNLIDRYDLQTFVRYDQYGLYGIKNNNGFVVNSLEDVKDKAHFAVTWDGFFIKNSYEGGGRVEITSDNDFRVLNDPLNQGNFQEKIKIGALEWGDGITSPTEQGATALPTLYGIRIKNNNQQTVMQTGDDGNLEITGTINATGGNFSDLVTVGKDNNDNSKPYIKIDGRSNTDATISSSKYVQDGASYGWMINAEGDAIFNNITARGAIKTAVFEYAEIQAVGGIFIFRPSSTIRNAERVTDTDDIRLTLEKPYLFKVGDWCKISNYTDGQGEPIATAILSNNGLTHVYKVKSIDANNSKILVLENAYTALISGNTQVINDITDLIGGALIDMGDNTNGNGRVGNSNYGIGINSSDNVVNLPARAISLFETIVDETRSPKVSYNYRGILGTLPHMSSGVNQNIYQHMEGTQGIYTDNMYIGDLNQYIAFYEDNNGNKQLKIKANQIVFEVVDEDTGESDWQDISEFDPEGTPGPAGQDAITVHIESNVGNEFIMTNETATLTCTVYQGTENITSQVTNFLWTKNQANGTPDTTWNAIYEEYNLPYITVTPSEINKKAVFNCRVTLPE